MFPEDLIESAARPQYIAPLRFERPVSRAFSPPKNRLWVHALLFVMTLFTTTLVGAHMQYNFSHNLAFFEVEDFLDIFALGLRSPKLFFSGLPFSLTLLTILTAHEMGHYLACLYYDVDATMPFFLPGPTPFTGTLGAWLLLGIKILGAFGFMAAANVVILYAC